MLGHHAKEIGCPPACSGGWIDHVHILCGLARTVSVAELLEHLKTETSKWIKRRACDLPDFRWQAGYGAFSVSQSAVPQVVDYIERQAEHHRTMSFQEEFRLICQKRNGWPVGPKTPGWWAFYSRALPFAGRTAGPSALAYLACINALDGLTRSLLPIHRQHRNEDILRCLFEELLLARHVAAVALGRHVLAGGSSRGKILQVVKVLVAAGGLLQFAQPAQRNKSQVV